MMWEIFEEYFFHAISYHLKWFSFLFLFSSIKFSSQILFFSGINSMIVQSRNPMQKLRSKGISEKRTLEALLMRICSPILGRIKLVWFDLKKIFYFVILANISNFTFQTKSAAGFHPGTFHKLWKNGSNSKKLKLKGELMKNARSWIKSKFQWDFFLALSIASTIFQWRFVEKVGKCFSSKKFLIFRCWPKKI